jgi:hypothetical protein
MESLEALVYQNKKDEPRVPGDNQTANPVTVHSLALAARRTDSANDSSNKAGRPGSTFQSQVVMPAAAPNTISGLLDENSIQGRVEKQLSTV